MLSERDAATLDEGIGLAHRFSSGRGSEVTRRMTKNAPRASYAIRRINTGFRSRIDRSDMPDQQRL